MKIISTLLATLTLTVGLPINALAETNKAPAATTQSASATSMSVGEVKKIDKDAGKITLKHGPLENLGMPAMTMVFRVKDAAMLDQVKPGDKVKFIAEKSNGALTVTSLQPDK